MLNRQNYRTAILTATLAALVAGRAGAIDTVTRKSVERRAAGEITSVTKSEVVVKPQAGPATTVPANDIESIEWDGEPAALGLARAKESSGQYALAIADYKAALQEAPAGKKNLRADIAYGLASATGKLALADAEQREAAITRLKEYLEQHPDHYRHYDAQLLLGRTYLAADDLAQAEQAFQKVVEAPWPDYQMAANVSLGRTALARGETTQARTAFDRVVAEDATTPAEQSRRFEAMLGQATCLQSDKQFDEAAKILGEVILQSAPDDTRLQAEAYLRQGDCYVALGDRTKDAVMAYLHVDVVPSLAVHNDMHAEALYRLVQLWPQVGHPERADSAAGKLQSLYPNSSWTEKLTGG